MKKLWAGIGILAVLLTLGIGAAWVMQDVHQGLAHQLEQAAACSRSDWEAANHLADSARGTWEKRRHLVAALVDHEPLEEINNLLDQLQLYQDDRHQESFAAVCLQLASLYTTLSESHSPYWWNLL